MNNKKRHKYYNKNHPIIRVDKDFKRMISKISKQKGLSHYEVIRRLLKTRYTKGNNEGYEKALNEHSTEPKNDCNEEEGKNNFTNADLDEIFQQKYWNGYSDGYGYAYKELEETNKHIFDNGFEAGRKKYSIKLPCQKCGKLIEFLPDRPEFVEFFGKLRTSHGNCEGQ